MSENIEEEIVVYNIECISEEKESITLTITEIDSVVEELVTPEILEEFIRKIVEEPVAELVVVPVEEVAAVVEEPVVVPVEEVAAVSLEENCTKNTLVEEFESTTDLSHAIIITEEKEPIKLIITEIKNEPTQPIRSLQIKQPTITLNPRFIQIPKQSPHKYIHHLRKMF